MKIRPTIILLAAATLLPSCGVSLGVSYEGFRFDVTLPEKKPKPAPEPPLPADDGTGKTPVLVDPAAA